MYKQSKYKYHIFNVAVKIMINNNNKTFKWKKQQQKTWRWKKKDNFYLMV